MTSSHLKMIWEADGFRARPNIMDYPYDKNPEYEGLAWLSVTIGNYMGDKNYKAKELNSIFRYVLDEDKGYLDLEPMILFLIRMDKKWKKHRGKEEGIRIANTILSALSDPHMVVYNKPIDKWYVIRGQEKMTVNKSQTKAKSKGTVTLARATPPPIGDNALF